ncbi:hypothetical protein [sulfur-oxidizing endosymbiont of Gigantopelta aegis]|uniref:hypothetical protein n=1 Tax=sulfur-oxidizing endosymbiont of Gigantopelta aegis TaxID=2794934 RepID=UPI0018DE4860|nr:hypothetical protein [sulfur-oxidizing endosymbiont of Gigantopelta aegis]
MKQSIWFYASLFPFFVAFIGFSMAYLSYTQQWGGDDKIATVIAVFFCEVVMVVAAFGALTSMKQEKNSTTTKIKVMNIVVAIFASASGIYLFLSQ